MSNPYEDREMVIRFKQVFVNDELSHWLATLELDNEQLYEETGVHLRDAADRIYLHVWEENTTIPIPWREAEVYTPPTPKGLLQYDPKDWV